MKMLTRALITSLVFLISATIMPAQTITVDITISLSTGAVPAGVEVVMTGEESPHAIYSGITDSTGLLSFTRVWQGNYTITAYKPGFELVEMPGEYIGANTSLVIVLGENRFSPRNLWVDPLTSWAHWEWPVVSVLNEDFESSDWPPAGWQSLTEGAGWMPATGGYSGSWTIPAWDSQYARSVDVAYSGNNGCCDYLVTPALDLRESDDFFLIFDSFYDGAWGHLATIEYSYDTGTTWEVLFTLPPMPGGWVKEEVDLADYCGLESAYPIWLAFHSDDAGIWASGWAIDNAEVSNGHANPLDFSIFLDDVFVDSSSVNKYQYQSLTYGMTYEASVGARYTSGLSEKIYYTFVSEYLAPPRNLDGETFDDAVYIWWEPPLDPSVPENILGYNVYRDMDTIAYLPYQGEDTSHYYDLGLEPSAYQYNVSALYDLDPYGFPGDTGESELEGPFIIPVQYGYPLPFEEYWTSGGYEVNQWSAGENWKINGQFGNPEPASEFTWDSVLTYYSSSLVSFPLDGINLTGDPYIDGCIWFEYDVKLYDRNTTGLESLTIEVGNEDGWYSLAVYDNALGSFEWIHDIFDITRWAFGQIFRVRFLAEGTNSADIQSWFVDNIEVYLLCMPPENIKLEVQWGANKPTVVLNWNSPHICVGGPGSGEWLAWDDGTNVNGIGLTGGGVFSVASHWDPDMLTSYDGMAITKIRFVPFSNAVNTVFNIKVWEGNNAGTLLIDQALTGYTSGEWNEVELDYPVYIDVTKELWFGYTCDSPNGENPAGYDAGPAVTGYGDMISLDEVSWDPILNYGTQFDLNWNLQALVMEPAYGTRLLQQYNIYTDGEFLDHTVDTFYNYQASYDTCWQNIEYSVTAVYQDCESDTAGPVTASIPPVGVEEIPEKGISVYPNPAREVLNIKSAEDISHITVMNNVGQVVLKQKIVDHNIITINVEGYEPGLYMLSIETTNDIIVKKVLLSP